jgi:hypothetical protein
MVTLSVALSLLKAGTTIDVGDTLGDHPVVSEGVKKYSSQTLPVLLTVTV